MSLSSRRLRLGRFQFYIEPRDAWVGVYVDPKAAYVCPLPFVVIRWDRHRHDPIECGCELTPAECPPSPFDPIVEPCGDCGCAKQWHSPKVGCTGDFTCCPCKRWVRP